MVLFLEYEVGFARTPLWEDVDGLMVDLSIERVWHNEMQRRFMLNLSAENECFGPVEVVVVRWGRAEGVS